MKKAGKKLIVSVFVLVVALSLAITSTFAWFTMSNTPSVDGFNVNVTTSEGLLIALDEGNNSDDIPNRGSFKTKITATDIQTYLTTNYANFKLDAVTSADGKTFKLMDGTTDGSANVLSIPFYFFSNVAHTISLNSTGNTITSAKNSETHVEYGRWTNAIAENEYGTAHAAIAAGTDIVAKAENAARISFDNGTAATIWYPHPDQGFNKDFKETKTGEEGSEVYTYAYDVDSYKNLAVEYYNYKNILTGGEAIALPTAYTTANGYFSQDYHSGTRVLDADLVTLALRSTISPAEDPAYDDSTTHGYYGKLIVNIWMEGWDGDCFDSIMDDILTINLKFVGTVA